MAILANGIFTVRMKKKTEKLYKACSSMSFNCYVYTFL